MRLNILVSILLLLFNTDCGESKLKLKKHLDKERIKQLFHTLVNKKESPAKSKRFYPKIVGNRQMFSVPYKPWKSNQINLLSKQGGVDDTFNLQFPRIVHYKHQHEEYVQQNDTKQKCDGFDNFLIDIGIVSYIISIISAVLGITSLILAYINQFVAYSFAYLVDNPSAFFTIASPANITNITPINYIFNINAAFTVFEALLNAFFGLPFNDQINLLSTVAEITGVIAIIVGFGSTFPDIFEEYLEIFLGINTHEVFKGYGCKAEAYSDLAGNTYLDVYNQTMSYISSSFGF